MAAATTDASANDRAAGLTAFAVVLAAFFFALRLVAASRSGLFFDEAYYWHWSTNLMPGYFDHPPGIAYFIRLGTLLFGDTALGIRFMPALSAPLIALLLWGIALKLTGSRRVAAWAAIFASLNGAALLSIAALPDEPMTLCWLAAVYALVSLYRGGPSGWWVVAGVAIGLAASSKFPAAMLGLGLLGWTLWEPAMRRHLGTGWPWLGVLAMLAVMAPLIVWNTERGWPALLMQGMRDGLEVSALDSLLGYLGMVALMASPPVFVLGLVGLFRGPQRPLLLLAILPIVLFLAAFAFTDEVTVNSIMPIAYWLALPAAFATAGASWWARGLAVLAVGLGATLTTACYVLFALPPGVAPDRLDLARTYRGWPETARAIEAVRVANDAAYIVADRYYYPGYLKLELGTDAPVFHLASRQYDTDYSQWRRWNGFPSARREDAEARAIFIGSEQAASRYYGSVTPLPPVRRPNGADRPPELTLHLVAEPKASTAPLFDGWRTP